MKNTILILAMMMILQVSRAQNILTPVEAGSKVHFVIKNFGFKTGDFSDQRPYPIRSCPIREFGF
ncbi:MAG: hypothetical protein IPI66_12000 [Chitinophagaceae bacterium]|nr:hypothetical protein [Chitinophagaceae bacterium]